MSIRRRLGTSFAALSVGLGLVFLPTSAAGAPPPPAVPSTLLELPVSHEDISKTVDLKGKNVAVDSVDMYSLRRTDKVLQATLEVARLARSVDTRSTDVRNGIIGLIGSTVAVDVRVDNQDVYVTASRGITNLAWFNGQTLFVLSVRNEFQQPKALLREALKIPA